MDEAKILLRMEGITKTFPPVTALQNVSFAVKAGSVHALCGENGAGKSTLMKILSGVYAPDCGKIIIDGTEQHFNGPNDALQAGIAMLYQELELAEHLTVYENIFLGRELLSNSLLHTVDTKEEIRQVEELMKTHGFNLDPKALIRTLSPGECQIVELIKALLRDAKIIVMDEPTSSLSASEAENLFRIIGELKKKNFAVVYISHRMEEILQLADEVTVLRDGESVYHAPASGLRIDTIVRHMVGREISDYYPARLPDIGKVRFRCEHISAENGIKDISFEVRAGEIVGMAGLVGAGRSETAQAIFGIVPKTSGRCFLDGKELHITNPGDAIRSGIAFLTEDRKRTGLCIGLPCSWNMTLPNYEVLDMSNFLNLRKESEICNELGHEVKIKWSNADAPAASLSGGNQQKVLLGRWLLAGSEFMIFDEPTRGIDVGARKEIYQLLNELATEGKAILVISSELQEIFGICDRILVMKDGHLTGNLEKDKTTPEEVMRLAAADNIK